MPDYLITVRDIRSEMECTTSFEEQTEEAARERSIKYFSNEIGKPHSQFQVVIALKL